MDVRTIAASVLLCGCVAWGQSGKSSAKQGQSAGGPQPRIQVKQRVFDLGRLIDGQVATATFVIENAGDAPLILHDVRASCGCTIPKKLTEEEKTLDPHETLELTAQFNSKGRVGKQRKTVTIISNDPAEPRLALVINAEVVTLMQVLIDGRAVRTISIGRISPGETVSREIAILPTEPNSKLEIASINVRSEVLTHELEPLSRDDRVGYRLKLSVVPDASPGPLSAPIRITGRIAGRVTEINIRANGEIVGELAFTPLQVRQTAPLVIGSRMMPVRIRSETGRPFRILEADAGPNVDVQVVEEKAGKAYLIEMHISRNASVGPFGSNLTLLTDSVVQPVIRIPVYGFVRPHLEVTPDCLYLRSSAEGKSGSFRIVKLETASRVPFEIESIETGSAHLSAEVTEFPGRPARGVRYVRVQIRPDAPSGTHAAEVVIKTSVTEQPVVTVPVRFDVS